MQHRIASRLDAVLGAVLLLSSAATLVAASRNYKPPAQVQKNAAQSYEFVTIDPPGGGFCPIVGAINDQRLAIVVYSHDDQCQSQDTMLWQGGQFAPLPQPLYPVNPVVSMGDVNNAGTVFGNFGDFDIQHAAVMQLNTGTLTMLPDVPGKTQNYGWRISESGQGVGQACEGSWFTPNNCVNWIWNGKSYAFFDFVPGIAVAQKAPWGFNNRGQIAWQVIDPDGYWHGYLQDGTQVISLDVPGAEFTFVWDMNNSGDVILDAFGTDQHYIWRKGAFAAIPDVPANWGSIYTSTRALNDRGDYAGYWIDANFNGHAFIAFRK